MTPEGLTPLTSPTNHLTCLVVLQKTNFYLLDGDRGNAVLGDGTISSTTDLDIYRLGQNEGVLSVADVSIEGYLGSRGVEDVTGSDTSNFIFGGFGYQSQDILAGGAGADTFLLAGTNFTISASECDIISDFDVSSDVIGLELGLIYADLSFEQSSGDCYIKDGNNNYLLKLQNVSKNDLDASNFNTTKYLDNALAVLKNSGPSLDHLGNVSVEATSLTVTTVSAQDYDDDPIIYNILSGYDADLFALDSYSGVLTLKSQAAPGQALRVNIAATDGIATSSKVLTINVEAAASANDAPTLLAPTGGSVTEDASTSVVTGSLTGSDPENDTLVYLVDGVTAASGSYTAVGSYGTLVLTSATGAYTYSINNAATSVQSLGAGDAVTEVFSVGLSDGTNTTASQNLSFTINGANDAPANVSLTKTNVTENSAGAIVGALNANDPDGDTITYSIANAGDGASFEIDGSNNLKLKSNVTADEDVKSSYSITINATDGNETASKLFTINVAGANDAPTLSAPTGGSVTEDASTSVVTGSLTGSDPENDTLVYLVDGVTAASGSYTAVGSYGTLVLTSATGAYTYSINNAATSVQSLGAGDAVTEVFSVGLSDGTNTTASQNLSFTINGANDAPANVSLTKTNVTENSAGAIVGTLNATDPDGDAITYSIANSGDGASFEIDGSNNLKLKSTAVADFSKKSNYSVSVSATDGNETVSKTFSISVNTVVANLTETEPNNSIATADTITSGVAIAGQTSSYSDDDYFKIVASAAGTISVAFTGDGTDYSYHDVSLVNASGTVLATERLNGSGTVTTEVNAAGSYYVLVDDSSDTDDYSITATYSSTTGARETEPNNSIATADTITSGVAIAGQTSSYSDDDYFKIVASAAGTISVAFTGDGTDYSYHDVSLVNASGTVLATERLNGSGTVTTEVNAAGSYYVLVDDSSDTDDYSITATYSSTTGARETEPNNSIATADTITSGVAIAGQTSSYSDDDYFKIVASAAGTISVAFTGDGTDYSYHDVSLVNASGTVLATERLNGSGTVTTEVNAAGSYYVLVDDSSDTDDYSITATYSSTTGARETEPNNSIATADTITSGVAIAGQTSSYSDDDYFKIVASAAGTISVAFTGDGTDYSYHDVSLVNASGTVLATERLNGSGTVTTEVNAAGSYYVLVDDSSDTDDYSITATYSSTTGARETEPNNSIATADTITSGVAIAGQTSSYSDDDYFKIVASAAGTISVAFTGDGTDYSYHDVSLVNASGTVLATERLNGSGTVTTEVNAAGSYYVLVDDSSDTDDYSITATYSSTTGARETEPNNSIATADTITSGVAIAGQTSSYSDDDYFKIVASAAGTISVAFTGDGTDYSYHDVSLVNASGTVLATERLNGSGTVTTEVNAAGSYYVLVDDSSDTDDYSITATYSSTTGARETEPNNSIATADTITSGVAIAGQTSSYSDDDYFKIVASAAGTISVAFTGDGTDYSYHDVSLVNASGTVLATERLNGSGTVTTEVNAAGSYYVLVDDSSDTDDYSITATYSSTTGARETEPNNSIATADTITSGVAIAGQTSSYSDDDYFKIVASAAGTISVAFTGDGTDYSYHDVSLVNASGTVLASKSLNANGTVIAEVNAAGSYYVLVDDSSDTDDYSITATYSSTTGARETESNDYLIYADILTSGVAVTGQTSSYSDDDLYRLDVNSAGTITLDFTGDGSDYYSHNVSIWNSDIELVALKSLNNSGSVVAEVDKAGTYYMRVNNSSDTDDYSITATHSSTTGLRETEGNNTISTADIITLGTAISGQTSSYSDDDYFKATVDQAGTLSLDFKSDADYYSHRVSLLNDTGSTLYSGSIDGDWAGSVTVNSAGSYYFLIDGSSDTDDYIFTMDIA